MGNKICLTSDHQTNDEELINYAYRFRALHQMIVMCRREASEDLWVRSVAYWIIMRRFSFVCSADWTCRGMYCANRKVMRKLKIRSVVCKDGRNCSRADLESNG